jgi:hypothetical protein
VQPLAARAARRGLDARRGVAAVRRGVLGDLARASAVRPARTSDAQ